MSSLTFNFKHKTLTFEVTIDESCKMSELKERIEEKTSVPKENQKIMISGKNFNDDTILSTLKLKSPVKALLMGEQKKKIEKMQNLENQLVQENLKKEQEEEKKRKEEEEKSKILTGKVNHVKFNF